jgi:hypothetical protein
MKNDCMIWEFRDRISGHQFMSKTGQALPLGRPRSTGARMSRDKHAEIPRERSNVRPWQKPGSGLDLARRKPQSGVIHFRAKSAVLTRSNSTAGTGCPRIHIGIAPWVVSKFPVHIQINPTYVLF